MALQHLFISRWKLFAQSKRIQHDIKQKSKQFKILSPVKKWSKYVNQADYERETNHIADQQFKHSAKKRISQRLIQFRQSKAEEYQSTQYATVFRMQMLIRQWHQTTIQKKSTIASITNINKQQQHQVIQHWNEFTARRQQMRQTMLHYKSTQQTRAMTTWKGKHCSATCIDCVCAKRRTTVSVLVSPLFVAFLLSRHAYYARSFQFEQHVAFRLQQSFFVNLLAAYFRAWCSRIHRITPLLQSKLVLFQSTSSDRHQRTLLHHWYQITQATLWHKKCRYRKVITALQNKVQRKKDLKALEDWCRQLRMYQALRTWKRKVLKRSQTVSTSTQLTLLLLKWNIVNMPL